MPEDQPPPVVRVAPLGELRAYTISEDELDQLARGGEFPLDLNFAVALLSIWVTIASTLLTVPLAGTTFIAFLCVGTITLISGLYCLLKGLRSYRSSSELVETIKNRLPPAKGFQESAFPEVD